MVEWLECCGCDQHGLNTKHACAILLCLWKRHFTELSPAWQSWQAVLNFCHTVAEKFFSTTSFKNIKLLIIFAKN